MIIQGECKKELEKIESNSIDSIVTDPPYGISFMNKKWDYDIPKKEVFQEMLRVLKPGGHILCACGTRTQHRMAFNIEDAGFEIRDVVSWIYGSGFPDDKKRYRGNPKFNEEKATDRYFYSAKASKAERNKGCEGMEEREGENGNKWTDQDYRKGETKPTTKRQNFHPTVKPIKLMQYLTRLITPQNGTCLDPYMGSGSTGIACKKENFKFIGIEIDQEYFNIAKARINNSCQKK